MVSLVAIFSIASAIQSSYALLNGVGDKPALGWNSYNVYNCYPNETTYRSNTKALVDLGLADLGYTYSTIDCGWTVQNRTDEGKLTWNETLFPSGFPKLGEWVHGLGLKLGVYQDSGIKLCGSPPEGMAGSLYHESVDAETFAEWGADSLKYDNCFSDEETGFPNTNYHPSTSPERRFANMSQYINTQNRPIRFQICEWGVDFPALWAPWLGHSFRIGQDIIPHWRAVARTLNQVVPIVPFIGPGQFADLDMLEVGNHIFTVPEEQTHFSMWAILKSPLTIGCALKDDFNEISPESLATLKNKDIISYNQDDLGTAASFRRRWTEERYEVWSGPLTGDRVVAALINWDDKKRTMTLDLPDIGLQYAKTLKNIWANTTAHDVLTSYTAEVQPHGVMLVELADFQPANTYPADFFASKSGKKTTFKSVYAPGTSNHYNLEVFFAQPANKNSSASISSRGNTTKTSVPAGFQRIQAQIPLKAGANNAVDIDSDLAIEKIHIIPPSGHYYPNTEFEVADAARRTSCGRNTCLPVGSKIGYIGQNGTITANLQLDSAGPKYVSLDLINNDIALQTAWDWGTNTRNLTISVNDGKPVRIEVPLTGQHSELYGENKGWWDSARHGVLLNGWKEGENKIVIGNVNDGAGETPWAPDFVGMHLLD